MKIKDLFEGPNKNNEPLKPRNFVAKHAAKTTSGAGAHRDKKKEQKQGHEKHKGKEVAEEAAGVGIVTKQNATVDVPVGGEYMNVKKLFPKKKKGVAEGFPKPGESSGKAKQFNPNAKVQTKEMTLDQILATVKGIPYVNNVVDDWDAKDYSWGVTKKVIEYAEYLQKNPQSVANLPPLVVIDGQLNDGAHRLSAINLLQKRMDPKNPLWKQVKLKVNFGTSADVAAEQGVAEGKKDSDELAKYENDVKTLLANGDAKTAKKVAGLSPDAEHRNRLRNIIRRYDSKQGVAEGDTDDVELYGLRIGDTVTTHVQGRTVQGNIIDIFPDTKEVELLLRGPEAGRTITVDVRQTEYLDEQNMEEGKYYGHDDSGYSLRPGHDEGDPVYDPRYDMRRSGVRSNNRLVDQPRGMYFYNVPAGKEQQARQAGLKQTKSGKWYSRMSNDRADKEFGKGRYWEPKPQGMAEVTGDKSFDDMMRQIKKGTKKQATADRKAEREESRKRARDAFGPNPFASLSIRKKDVDEESELGDLAHQTTLKHRFLVSYSDPNHTMASKRKERLQKHVLAPSTNKNGESVFKGDIEPLVKKHMTKQGFRVHEIEHVGMVSVKVNAQGVKEGSKFSATDDVVGFTVNSEKAYNVVMRQFGDYIDFDEDEGVMYVPEKMWPKVEMAAFDADGEGATRADDDGAWSNNE